MEIKEMVVVDVPSLPGFGGGEVRGDGRFGGGEDGGGEVQQYISHLRPFFFLIY